jgi:hypothetical protein
VLVCALATAGPDCDRSNALDVVVQPAESAPACLKVGETIAAQSLGAPAPGTYHKIACEHRKDR